MSTFAVILPAAGKSSRFRDPHYKKPFIPLNNRPVWLYSAEKFVNRDDVKQVIVAISPEDREHFDNKFAANTAILGIEVVEGGADRETSVANALARVRDDIGYVAVHDAARPCLADAWIDNVFQAAVKTQAAILATPVSGTLKIVGANNLIEQTTPREGIWEAQTPQVFARELLLEAFAKRQPPAATDEAQMVERLGKPVFVVLGSKMNIKITTKEDLAIAKQLLAALPKPNLFGRSHPFAD